MREKMTVFSGIQPTGHLTIGNYIGALKHWQKFQETSNCIFCLVDLHSQTVRNDVSTFADRCLDFIALYIACGIDPEQSAIFVQSHIAEHSELAWILSCHTPYGDLKRMTQFKDKSARNPKNINAGLLNYPVLMAADILLYQADAVPVGDDQKQHLELSRDIASRFNRQVGPVFIIPEPMIPSHGARVRNLKYPNQKMSKTDDDAASYIALLDTPSDVERKIRKAVTNTDGMYPDHDDGSGIANLMSIFAAVDDCSFDQVLTRYSGGGFSDFKQALADCINAFLEPIRIRYSDVRSDSAYLNTVLMDGAEKVQPIAAATLGSVQDALGLIPRVRR